MIDTRVKTKCLDCDATFDDTLLEWVKWMEGIGIDVQQKRHTHFDVVFYSEQKVNED